METFVLFAVPWWTNLLILVPFAAYYFWQKEKLSLSWQILLFTGLFAIGFGFVEASVVVYLRAALGLLPGFEGTLTDVIRNALTLSTYEQTQILQEMPRSLLVVELFRETATMIMFAGVALIAAKKNRERFAMFLWMFAIWDIVYYAGLWATTRWPTSLLTPDILFLIPVPWISQVWFPILISALSMAAVLLTKKKQ